MGKWPQPAQTDISVSDVDPAQHTDVSVNTEVLAATLPVTPILSVRAKNSHRAEPSLLVSVQ